MAWKNVQYENGKYRTSEGGGGGSSTFADLEDVSFSDLQNGQIPKYNSGTGKWENANESGGGGTVTDVQVDGVSVVNQQGVAEIEMPAPPTIPVEDVEVNGESVVNAQKVAEIKSYKEVTQSEYNALPASKTSDGILYCIKDAGGADGFPPLIYSDEEREVGVWRDGKPLYQKSFYMAIISAGTSRINHNIDNLGQIANAFGMTIPSESVSDKESRPIPFTYSTGSSSSEWYSGFTINNTEIMLQSGSSFASRHSHAYITVQYTKTTDVAGSGTWTTRGGYAHHYSADEHIIGTWFGKTLWEKTIYYSSPGGTADTNKIIDTSIKHGVNCNVVDVRGVQTYGYLNGNMPNDTSDPEPIAQSNLYLPYYAPSTSTNITPAHIYFYSDGVHFMKRCASSEANGIILTVRYVKK